MSKIIETDVLVIGSGLAGLLATIKVLESGAKVTLVCKTGLAESNSRYAQGGIAAAAPIVSNAPAQVIPGGAAPIEAHLKDTIKAGAGLVDEQVAREIVTNGWRLIEVLSSYGVVFDHLPNGSYSLALEGGHSAARVYHHQDVTGTWICNALIERLQLFSSLQILENTFACNLIMANDVCIGARLINKSEITNVFAKHTILATGGLGQVYSRTTNPAIATGDGIAMAYQAGVELIDMEFMQFHPTALRVSDDTDAPVVLISEAVRGAGAILLDHNKQRFMHRFDPAAELATRDIVARSMCAVMQETGSEEILLDLRPIGKEILQEKFPNILRQLNQNGIDALNELVPVSPAAHYFMGGIRANTKGETSIASLYAIGECASTGLHGANRLASNSLLEAGVMALDVAQLIANKKTNGFTGNMDLNNSDMSEKLTVPTSLSAMRQNMFAKAGIIRSANSLEGVIAALNSDTIKTDYSIKAAEAANLLLISKLIAQTALRREESRGAHYRSDWPKIDEKFSGRQIVKTNTYEWTGNKDLCRS